MAMLYTPLVTHHPDWITLQGRDARDYLQRMTTVNFNELTPGHGARGAWLTPQGKFLAYFTVWCAAQDYYAFEIEAGMQLSWRTRLLQIIDRFKFSEQFELKETRETTSCRWFFPDQDEQNLVLEGNEIMTGEIVVAHHGSREYGRPRVSLWGTPQTLDEWCLRHRTDLHTETEPLDLDSLERMRILAMYPRIDHEITPDLTPLEVGLLDSVAQNKGCYPGQEVIEKVISLGSPARRLVRVRGLGAAPRVPSPLFNEATPPVEFGTLTSAVSSLDGTWVGLAVVRKTHAKVNMRGRINPSQEIVSTNEVVLEKVANDEQ